MNHSDKPAKPGKKLRGWSDFAVYCLVFFAVGTTLASALLVDMNPLFPLAFAALAYAVIRVFAMWKPGLAVFAVTAGMIVLFLHRFRPSLVDSTLAGIKSLLDNIVGFLRGRESISPINAFPLWIVLSTLLCALSFSEIIRFRRAALYFPIYLSILIAYWYQGIDGTFPMIILLVAATLFFYGLERRSGKDSGSPASRGRARTALFYSLAVTLGALLLPDFSVLFDSARLAAGLDGAIPASSGLRRIFASNRVARNPGLFNFRETGFQPGDTVLGGAVVKKTDPVMSVVSAVPLYMRGNVKTFYIYNNWIAETFVDSIVETNSPFSRSVEPEKLFKIRINSLGQDLRIAFAPYRTRRIDSDRHAYMVYNEDDIATFPEVVHPNESYTLYASLAGDSGLSDDSDNPLVNPARYLQVPWNMPERVVSLAARICEGIDAPLGKAFAIRDFLRKGYVYSLESPAAPPQSDFVDYFLFDLKRGYCTYFATALAIMLRTQGIPSRYVEGYLAQDLEESGAYLVRQDDAHAWVEAFFEGAGWVTLDATPGVDLGLANAGRNYLTGVYREKGKSEGDLVVSSDDETANRSPSSVDEVEISEAEPSELRSFWLLLVGFLPRATLIVFFSAILLLLLRIVILRAREKLYWKRLKLESEAIQLVALYRIVLGIMALMKEKILPGETSLEFSWRIRNKLDNSWAAFKVFTDDFATARYSRSPLRADAVRHAYSQFSHMDRRLRSYLGPFRYAWIRSVKGGLFTLRIDF